MYVSLINVYNFKIRDVILFEVKAPRLREILTHCKYAIFFRYIINNMNKIIFTAHELKINAVPSFFFAILS